MYIYNLLSKTECILYMQYLQYFLQMTESL